ncbi:mucin-3A [Bicyclus anynana]|uniref:Mucin-3A n=1 Tax=Bicyclus anynana TaxID=110368 RepID=A0A6J1NRW0_BICAN|nr:mucin-3A [Bicyclus anynana]
MNGVQLCLLALATLTLLLSVAAHRPHRRRSLVAQAQNLPVSKGGWRPVVGSGGLLYGSLNTAPLHAPYKIPVSGLEMYHSSARPLIARDVNKLTSIAQSYRPTTLRTVPVTSHLPPNQPINSYLNPFALPNNLNHYKFLQNYPIDSMLFRNPPQTYSARPVKTKQKQQYHNILQQFSNVQPIQYGQYNIPLDMYGKIDYPRQDTKRPQSAETEIFKPEVYKLPDSETASQFNAKPVKTVQQQTMTSKLPINQYGHPFQDNVYNMQQFPSFLGTFGSFGLQSVKGRDHLHPNTKTTYLPPQPTKQTIFNSFSYSPNFKTTSALFSSTTPKIQTTQNHLIFGSTFNDLGNVPTPQTKVVSPLKIDPNGSKNYFKASPQDPFIKNFHNFDYNKITTYNPPIIQSTTQSAFNDYYQSQNYDDPETVNINYDKTKQKLSDNVGLTQQVSQQYANAPGLFDLQNSFNALSHRPTYAVVENVSEDINTETPAWTVTPQSHGNNQKLEETVTKPENTNNIFEKPTTTNPDSADEYAIVTESDKGYENGFNYESHIDTQSRRPLGDDFEPIGKTKLKEYYYKVSTPTYDHKTYRRTKKPNESQKQDVTTQITNNISIKDINDAAIETLPTLPPNLHFKRPSTSEPLVDKDKIRKRNKIRRRRPINRNKEETTTRRDASTEASTTIAEEIPTIRPRVRPIKTRTESSLTTPTVTTDLTTSALPTTSATKPTVIRKKLLGHRRPLTTPSEKIDTTTQATKVLDQSKESPIMKISSRIQSTKLPTNNNEQKTSEIPDYSHKQDEKDTPTSDVSVSLNDNLNEFSFHRDVRPVGIKESTTESIKQTESTTIARTESDSRTTGKIQRPRLKNKLDRPKFSVKDYRNRLNSTTSTTEKVEENTPKARHAPRKNPYSELLFTDVETTTERKKFTPKEPRYKLNKTEINEQEIHSRHNGRVKQAESEVTTQKISSRIRIGQRRPKPTEDATETTSPTTVHSKRPQRKKIPDSEIGQSVQDITVTETANNDHKNDITSERTRSESAIMKIADKKHQDHIERLFEHSKRVSDLTLAASKDYNTPGMFKTLSSNSRRIPSYFTIATDDPILPIEAFFPQLNQKKES